METLTEKNDQQSSVAELQEKIGILLAVVFYVNSFVVFFFCILKLGVFLSLHSCPLFPLHQGRWGSRYQY